MYFTTSFIAVNISFISVITTATACWGLQSTYGVKRLKRTVILLYCRICQYCTTISIDDIADKNDDNNNNGNSNNNDYTSNNNNIDDKKEDKKEE